MFKIYGKLINGVTVMRMVTTFILVLVLISGIVVASYSEDVSSGLAENLIRLHVIANSDSPEDQQLKRDIRDKVIDYMKDKFDTTKDINVTKRIINENLESLTSIAKDEISEYNKEYDVKVMLGDYPFPTKAYGDITLPAGNYQALRVVIGEGEGQNWWCVLFPPLCFVDATHGTVSDEVKEDLKQVLTEEEYCLIAAIEDEDEDEIPIEIKFKVVEMFESSKLKVSGMVTDFFKTIFKDDETEFQAEIV